VKRKAALVFVALAMVGPAFAAVAAPAHAHQGKSSSTSALDKS
jgi:hypothetical protein